MRSALAIAGVPALLATQPIARGSSPTAYYLEPSHGVALRLRGNQVEVPERGPITLDMQTTAALGRWLAAQWTAGFPAWDGRIVGVDASGHVVSVLALRQASLTQVTFPAMAAGGSNEVSVQLQVTPVAHSNQPATGNYDQSGSDQSTRASNFRLDITGLSLGTVSDVAAITFRPSSHDCPGPTLHVPAAQAANVQQWMQRILVAGNAQGASSTTAMLTVYDYTKNTRAFAIEWQRSTPMDLVFDGGSQSQAKLRLACAVLRVKS